MKRMIRFAHRTREEHGITGLETAIVLIAFVVVAAVFAFVVLSTGLFSSERSKETVYAGLAKTRGAMELTGSVLATSNQTKVTSLTFDLTLAAGGDQVNLNPSSTSNKTIISYVDGSINDNNLTYTTTVLTGNSDKLLESGELFQIDVTLPSGASVGANVTFTLQVQPPTGSFMVIQRTTPASIAATVLNLN